jgi:hypothetical protein
MCQLRHGLHSFFHLLRHLSDKTSNKKDNDIVSQGPRAFTNFFHPSFVSSIRQKYQIKKSGCESAQASLHVILHLLRHLSDKTSNKKDNDIVSQGPRLIHKLLPNSVPSIRQKYQIKKSGCESAQASLHVTLHLLGHLSDKTSIKKQNKYQ